MSPGDWIFLGVVLAGLIGFAFLVELPKGKQ